LHCIQGSRIGGIVAPYIVLMAGQVGQGAPMLAFAIVSLIAAFLCFLLPETRGMLKATMRHPDIADITCTFRLFLSRCDCLRIL
jgi:hypothetical protein